MHKKKLVFRRILPYWQNFFGIGATIRIGRENLCLPYVGFFVSFFLTREISVGKCLRKLFLPFT